MKCSNVRTKKQQKKILLSVPVYLVRWQHLRHICFVFELAETLCFKANYPDLGSVKNGKLFASAGSPHRHGHEIVIICNAGYKLAGESSVQCAHGKFNKPIPACIKVTSGWFSSRILLFCNTTNTNHLHSLQQLKRCNAECQNDGYLPRLACIQIHTAWTKIGHKFPDIVQNGDINKRVWKKDDWFSSQMAFK